MAKGRKKTDKNTLSIRLHEDTETKLDKLVDYYTKDTQQNASIQMEISRSAVIEHLINTDNERILLASEYDCLHRPTLLKREDANYTSIVAEHQQRLEKQNDFNGVKIKPLDALMLLGLPYDKIMELDKSFTLSPIIIKKSEGLVAHSKINDEVIVISKDDDVIQSTEAQSEELSPASEDND